MINHFRMVCLWLLGPVSVAALAQERTVGSPYDFKLSVVNELRAFDDSSRSAWRTAMAQFSIHRGPRWAGVAVSRSSRFGIAESEFFLLGGGSPTDAFFSSVSLGHSSGRYWRPRWSLSADIESKPIKVDWAAGQWQGRARVGAQKLPDHGWSKKMGLGLSWFPVAGFETAAMVESLWSGKGQHDLAASLSGRWELEHGVSVSAGWGQSSEFEAGKIIGVRTTSLAVGKQLNDHSTARLYVVRESRPDLGMSTTVGGTLGLDY